MKIIVRCFRRKNTVTISENGFNLINTKYIMNRFLVNFYSIEIHISFEICNFMFDYSHFQFKVRVVLLHDMGDWTQAGMHILSGKANKSWSAKGSFHKNTAFQKLNSWMFRAASTTLVNEFENRVHSSICIIPTKKKGCNSSWLEWTMILRVLSAPISKHLQDQHQILFSSYDIC